MDWSLVLASQQVEATILPPGDSSGWRLLVPETDATRALEAIRLYQAENRHWRWRQKILQGAVVFDWTSLLWVVLLVTFFWFSQTHPSLRDAALMQATAVSRGQLWRLFTAMWLHADISHLASNAGLGLILVGLLMGKFGTGVGFLVAYVAGLGGNLAVWVLASGNGSLGASGLVMGSLGLLAGSSLSLLRSSRTQPKLFVTGAIAGLLLFVLTGLAPGTDIRAHLGGFLTGLVAGTLLSPFQRSLQKPLPNLLAALLVALLIVWPWLAAFRSV